MSSKSSTHVVKSDSKWVIKQAGIQVSTHRTQEIAIKKATTIAKNDRSELIVHRPDGRIRSKDSYGNDPMPPRDTEH